MGKARVLNSHRPGPKAPQEDVQAIQSAATAESSSLDVAASLRCCFRLEGLLDVLVVQELVPERHGIIGSAAQRRSAAGRPTTAKEVIEEDSSFYRIIQSVLVAHLHGNAAQISVEIGRGSVPSTSQPSFLELEETLSTIPAEG